MSRRAWSPVLVLVLLSSTAPSLAAAADRSAAVRLVTQRVEDEGKRPGIEQYNLGKRGLALAGYDPVSYFPAGGGKPLKGKAELALTLKGVTYRFASEEHRKLFQATPERFEPAYGGWCAYAMAAGRKVEVDPESFRIEDGRLLLFYKSFFSDTRKSWEKEGPEVLRPKADAAWKRLLETPPPKD